MQIVNRRDPPNFQSKKGHNDGPLESIYPQSLGLLLPTMVITYELNDGT